MKRPESSARPGAVGGGAGALPVALAEIFAPGAIGLFVVGKTLLFYLGKDATAALLVVAMGVGLVFGLLELLGSQQARPRAGQ